MNFWQPWGSTDDLMENPPDGIYISGEVHRQPLMELKSDESMWMQEDSEGYVTWHATGADPVTQMFGDETAERGYWDMDWQDMDNWYYHSDGYKALIMGDDPTFIERLEKRRGRPYQNANRPTVDWESPSQVSQVIQEIYTPVIMRQMQDQFDRIVQVPVRAADLTDDELYAQYLRDRRNLLAEVRRQRLQGTHYSERRANVDIDDAGNELPF